MKRKMAPRKKYKLVKVGRFDDSEGLKEIAFDNGNTVQDCLDKANITLGSGEEINDINGRTLKLDQKVKHGQSLILTGSYKSG